MPDRQVRREVGVVAVIDAGRVLLRHPRKADLAGLVATWTDPDVARFMGDFGPRDPRAVQAWLDEVTAAPEPRSGDRPGSVQFIVVLAATEEVIGWLGMGDSSDALAEWSFGYALRPEARGHGYAGEALAAGIDTCRRSFGIESQWGECDPDNVASARTMLGAGLREVAAGPEGSRRFVTTRGRESRSPGQLG